MVSAYSKTDFTPKKLRRVYTRGTYKKVYAYSKTELESQGDDRSERRA